MRGVIRRYRYLTFRDDISLEYVMGKYESHHQCSCLTGFSRLHALIGACGWPGWDCLGNDQERRYWWSLVSGIGCCFHKVRGG